MFVTNTQRHVATGGMDSVVVTWNATAGGKQRRWDLCNDVATGEASLGMVNPPMAHAMSRPLSDWAWGQSMCVSHSYCVYIFTTGLAVSKYLPLAASSGGG
jgi:hypothetical protein